MTQTIVVVNTNDHDDNNYQEKNEKSYVKNSKFKYKNRIHDISSSESSEYEEIQNSNGNGTISHMNEHDALMKDLYGQRHIAYFDPSTKFQHVESIENEDMYTRIKNVSYFEKKKFTE